MAQYDKRIQAEQQLAAMYGKWAGIVQQQIRVALHGILRSLLLILLALIGIVLAEGFVERFYAAPGRIVAAWEPCGWCCDSSHR